MYDFDPLLARMHRLGQEVRSLLSPADAVQVADLLRNTALLDRLASDMGPTATGRRAQLSALAAGFSEEPPR